MAGREFTEATEEIRAFAFVMVSFFAVGFVFGILGKLLLNALEGMGW